LTLIYERFLNAAGGSQRGGEQEFAGGQQGERTAGGGAGAGAPCSAPTTSQVPYLTPGLRIRIRSDLLFASSEKYHRILP